jgi:hypothetical protein
VLLAWCLCCFPFRGSVKDAGRAIWRSQASKLVVTTRNGVPTNTRDWRLQLGRATCHLGWLFILTTAHACSATTNAWHAKLVNRLVALPSSIIARAKTTRISRKYDKNPMGLDWLSIVLFVCADVLFPCCPKQNNASHAYSAHAWTSGTEWPSAIHEAAK